MREVFLGAFSGRNEGKYFLLSHTAKGEKEADDNAED